jgi:hypothetical protein
VDIELVRIDGALHHRLAEAVARGDEDRVPEAGFGVEREHDPGGGEVAAHHALDTGRQGHVAMYEALVDAVGDGPVVEQRGEDLFDPALDIVEPRTLRKVSCWPAKEASGRSSAVAEERTAQEAASPDAAVSSA